MDLLGSILNSMDKPLSVNKNQKEIIKKQKEAYEKMKKKEQDDLNKFRSYAEERIGRFVKNEDRKYLQFQILDKLYRSLVHDIAETAGLVGMSFGHEGYDRYIIVYKKDSPPCEDEIAARKNGDDWNEEIAKEYIKNREELKTKENEWKSVPKDIIPNSNYKDKYVHLIGHTSALDAARKTQSNHSYGFVPSANKKDVRSIEQTMADIQAKKRLKVSQSSE